MLDPHYKTLGPLKAITSPLSDQTESDIVIRAFFDLIGQRTIMKNTKYANLRCEFQVKGIYLSNYIRVFETL